MPSDPLPLSPETEAGRELLGRLPWPKRLTVDGFHYRMTDLRTGIIAIEQEARTLARTQLRDELTRALDLIVTSPIQDGPYKDGWADALEAVRDEVALSRLGAALRESGAPS